ncbi:NPCBM/NEW2 domain-containing protein [Paenibacillus dakarensis]|uniref:NPCBM/NEW2 domain-containing protein n=1 Tax=Paenibacillus dakarensis TaxID=1527293 RepID=UPI0006D592A0|nr:NPCBM/NEW2 domain-containing protein [Paenibacillus dakarensis]
MKDKVKGLVLGITIGTLITGGSAYAASNTKINVVFENVKYMFNGVHKQTTKSIVYNGQLYVPAKNAAATLDQSFSYDGKNKTAWFGKKEGSFKYLDEISYARTDGENAKKNIYFKNWTHPSNLKFTIAGNKYLHGIGSILDIPSNGKDYYNSVDYNLNGKYKKLTGYIGVDDYTKNSDNTGTVIIKGDGEELYRLEGIKGGDMPVKVNIDMTGVLKLQIVFESSIDNGEQIDLVIGDAKLF